MMKTNRLSQQTWFPRLLGHEMDKGEHTFPISQANLKFEAFNALQLHRALLSLLMKGENLWDPFFPLWVTFFKSFNMKGTCEKSHNLKEYQKM
jgi:hypothetical protein